MGSPLRPTLANMFLVFLDIPISRNNNALETSIFRKPTFTGVYTNFNTFLSTEYKRFAAHVVIQKI